MERRDCGEVKRSVRYVLSGVVPAGRKGEEGGVKRITICEWRDRQYVAYE